MAEHFKHATTDYPIHRLLRARWSPRAYAERPISPDDLTSLFEAARWAASGGNGQPWRFIAATRADPETHARLVACLYEANAEWAIRAPLLLLVVAQTMRGDGKPNRTAFYDCGLAVGNMSLQTTELGLHVHQMGGFSLDQAREHFGIPEGFEPVAAIAIGYLGDDALLSEQNRERERAPRSRKPLAELVFGGEWGAPAPWL